MRHYVCYFLKRNGANAAWRSVQYESDGEANDHALGLLVGYPHAETVEVWNSARLVLSYNRSMARTPAELRRLCYLAITAAEKEADVKTKRIIAAHAAALAQEAEALERREG